MRPAVRVDERKGEVALKNAKPGFESARHAQAEEINRTSEHYIPGTMPDVDVLMTR